MSINNTPSFSQMNVLDSNVPLRQAAAPIPKAAEQEQISEEVANAGNTGKVMLASGVAGGLAGLVGAYRWKAFNVVDGETLYDLGHINSNTDRVLVENMIREENSDIRKKMIAMCKDEDTSLKKALTKYEKDFELSKLAPAEREKFNELFEMAYKQQHIANTRSTYLEKIASDVTVKLNDSIVSMCKLTDDQLAKLSKEELDKVYKECAVCKSTRYRDMQAKQIYEIQRYRNHERHIKEFVDEKGKVKPLQKHMDKTYARINEAMRNDAVFQKFKAGAKYGAIAAAVMAPIAYFFVRKKGTQQ